LDWNKVRTSVFTKQRIRDPLHNLIEFEANEFESVLWSVAQTRPFQRLRRVKQLGFSDFVYPGATHSRLMHSLGVFHTARRLMRVIESHLGAKAYEQTHARVALAAALVHDLGHGPFSHAFEEFGKTLKLKMAKHEALSDVLIRNSEVSEAFRPLGSGFANDVADVINSAGPGNIYSAVVSSQFDADRLDYMQRDRLMTGSHLGAIDFEWLIANLEVGQVPFGVDEKSLGTVETFVLGPKAIHAAETYVLGLFQLYPTVYLHKATRGAEKIFASLLFRVFSLVRRDLLKATGLPNNHPLIRFAKQPDVVDNILALDDSVIWGALPLMMAAKDSSISELSFRLHERRLYKCLDVHSELAQAIRDHKKAPAKRKATKAQIMNFDKACVTINEKLTEWASHNKEGGMPTILIDVDVREPYKRFQESKGPLNQIRIRTPDGELVDLGERSKIVAAIEPFRLFRVYIERNDTKTQEFVRSVIQKEAKNAAKH
jgi:uncharacterized protein